MENLETITQIYSKIKKGEQLNASEAHVVCDFILKKFTPKELRELFNEESGGDCYAYDGKDNVIGFCANYVEWLEEKITHNKNN